ncbi:MAG TPA: M23 family metallopeptidase, partial [Thermodesulfovibrionales bacterium]|nr:M23 family metallopeptidase [Thermodesulfovibrionales bacterium]
MGRAFLISALCVLIGYSYADAFQATLLPSRINPGDAFLVKVSEARKSEIPAAFLNDKEIPFSRCGEACFVGIGAVALEAKPGRHMIHLRMGGKSKQLPLLVTRAWFPTLFLTLPKERVFLSPDDLKRAEREEERLQSLWTTMTDRLWEGTFLFPLNHRISSAFGTKRMLNQKVTSIHKGVDIKGKEGDGVRASNKGRVVLAEELFFGGNTVILDHGQGIFTLYMHLSSFTVRPDDIVSTGDLIGFVGSSGRSSGPHLHFGVKIQGISVNPVSLVKLM